MTVRYLFTSDGENHSLTFCLPDGVPQIVDGSHPNFREIVKAARAGDSAKIDTLLSVGKTLDSTLPNEFTRQGGTILYKGEALSEALSQSIIGVLDTNGDLAPLTKFAARLEANPSKHSRDQLFAWMNNYGININEDGHLIAYKGVNTDLTSISAGPGIVNGERVKGNLDNTPGNVVEIERRYVDDDPNAACSTGLHVGNWDYASRFGPVTVTVAVDPADVVSVPHDCHAAKVRVAQYRVVDKTEAQWTRSTVWDGSKWDYLDEEPDEDLFPTDPAEEAWEAGAVDAAALVAPNPDAYGDYADDYLEGYRESL